MSAAHKGRTAMVRTSSPLRAKRLIQGRELAVSIAQPPTLRELVFDAANLCTILAMLFDLYAISATLKDRNYHLAIALGQMSAMCVPISLVCKAAKKIFIHPF